MNRDFEHGSHHKDFYFGRKKRKTLNNISAEFDEIRRRKLNTTQTAKCHEKLTTEQNRNRIFRFDQEKNTTDFDLSSCVDWFGQFSWTPFCHRRGTNRRGDTTKLCLRWVCAMCTLRLSVVGRARLGENVLLSSHV